MRLLPEAGLLTDWMEGVAADKIGVQLRHPQLRHPSVATSFSRDILQSRHPSVATSFSRDIFLSGDLSEWDKNKKNKPEYGDPNEGLQRGLRGNAAPRGAGRVNERQWGGGSEWTAGYDKR